MIAKEKLDGLKYADGISFYDVFSLAMKEMLLASINQPIFLACKNIQHNLRVSCTLGTAARCQVP